MLIDDLISVHRAVERGEFRERFRDEFDQYVSIAHLDIIRLELGAVPLEIGHVHTQIKGDGGAGHMGVEHVARDSLAHAVHIHGLLACGSLLHRYAAVMQILEDIPCHDASVARDIVHIYPDVCGDLFCERRRLYAVLFLRGRLIIADVPLDDAAVRSGPRDIMRVYPKLCGNFLRPRRDYQALTGLVRGGLYALLGGLLCLLLGRCGSSPRKAGDVLTRLPHNGDGLLAGRGLAVVHEYFEHSSRLIGVYRIRQLVCLHVEKRVADRDGVSLFLLPFTYRALRHRHSELGH